MTSGERLFDESVHFHLTEMQNQLRMTSYADNLLATQPFIFTNSSTTPSPWSHVDFVPEKIVDLSVTIDGLRFYKVQWHHSWVAEHQLLPFQHVLQAFWTNENEAETKSNSILKKLITSRQGTVNLPSINNLSSKIPNRRQKVAEATSTAVKTAVKPVGRIGAPLPVASTSASGDTGETVAKEFSNNEISGKSEKSSECKPNLVDPTLATETISITNSLKGSTSSAVNTIIGGTGISERRDTVNAEISTKSDVDRGNAENMDAATPSEKPSDQAKSYEREISKALSFKLKHERITGKSVKCDGLDIIGIQNSNLTDDMVRARALEILSSFKKKRRKYDKGESWNDPRSCYFCMKVLSNSKHLRLHYFRIHLKHFGHLSCDICQQRFFYPRDVKAHKVMHSEERKWVCQICQAVFKFDDGLAKHMKIHQKESNFRCDVCHKNFKVQAELKTHCLEEHKNDCATCNVCKAKLQSGHSVYLHSLRHSGTRDHQCDECGKSFKRKHHLTGHKKTHSSEKGVECPVCKRKVSGKRILVDHINAFHKEYATPCKTKFKCDICDKPFRNKVKMDIHVKMQHTNETREEYQGRNWDTKHRKKGLRAKNISDEELARLSDKIEKVTDAKTGDVRVRCKLCGQDYLYIGAIEKHLDDHKNGKLNKQDAIVCKACGKKYKSKYYLLRHRNLHCRVRKGKAVKPLKTLRSGKRKIFTVEDIHAKVEKITDVDGKVRFKCKECPQREFELFSSMKEHLLEHENHSVSDSSKNRDELFCEECGKSFKMKKRLILHQKIAHPKWITHGNNSEAANRNLQKKKNRKRKQQLPMKLDTRGKRSAALNAKSMLHVQVQEVSSGEEAEVEVVKGDDSDYEPYEDRDMVGEQ